ncbi:lipoyl(octanoyl) transferase LipB [Zooshikella marina]|uniref:lipoyl(octanoyl) transferase LipB n=1 Tax=Zooshikella ganghwensis TaxID=202772 RepID=UPI001BB02704|nr:lipoyl(octanoyl) transferase LipB [Zooshikella ganghwensis]MBU2708389.1 lipoyl(octanoyl) transferase LipB [Zooshikella ganghwensis]
MSLPLIVRHLGLQPYLATWQRMQAHTAARHQDDIDEIWLLEHPQVFTQGQAGKAEHVLAPGDIPIVSVDRGGQVTYHGPGQLIVYLLINVKRKQLGVRALVTALENAIIETLKGYSINAVAKQDAPGVYVDEAKIASLGLRIRKGCSYHGLALNVKMDLEPFSRINPCGYAGMAMTQLAQWLPKITVAEVGEQLQQQLTTHLDYQEVITKNDWN